MRKRVIVAGHRPDRLGGYSDSVARVVREFALESLSQRKHKIDTVYTGMSQGWETATAEACIELGLPFVAALPFDNQEKFWSETAQERYHVLLEKAAEVVVVSPGPYSPEKTAARDQWLVSHGDVVLALWDGQKGGAGSLIYHAQAKGLIVANLWTFYQMFLQQKEAA